MNARTEDSLWEPEWYVKDKSDDEVAWIIQAIALVTDVAYLTGIMNDSPIVLPPAPACAFDNHHQHEHANNTECEGHYGGHQSIIEVIGHEINRHQPPLERTCHWSLMKQASTVYQFQSMAV